jgi:hypothetical protein
MSDSHKGPQCPREARIAEDHHAVSPPGWHVLDPIDHRGRRRYYLGPQPCRPTDVSESASTRWMLLVCLVILLIALPLPWWW